MVGALIISLRPKQWTKNLLLFAGLMFSQNFLRPDFLLSACAGFGLFCLLSGAVYLVNDVRDIEKDRMHPVKSGRPLASGRLSITTSVGISMFLMAAAVSVSFFLDVRFGWVALSYLMLMLGYSLVFKGVVILDVIVIAFGFVLRAVAGAVLIDVTISSWLLVCTTFLALFLAMSKRRHELILLGDEAPEHRTILSQYSPQLLDQMIAVVTASTVMSYALYTTAADTVAKFGTRNLIWTLPFVLYGIFRYLYLVHKKEMGGNPEQILVSDKPMILNIVLYLCVVAAILYR